MSRYEADMKKKPDDSRVDEVGDVLNSPDTRVSTENIGLFKKGAIRQELPVPCRPPESLKSIFSDTKTPFSKAMFNYNLSGQEMNDTFINYIKGFEE